MMPPAGPADPGGTPTANAGTAADAMTKVRAAIDMLEAALPGIPVGTDPHKSVLSAIQQLSKTVPPSEAIPGVQMATLTGLAQTAQQSAPLQALTRAMGQGPNVPPVMGQ